MLIEGGAPQVQVLFSVPKRRFPLAVHRNLLKRRMRESYRLQKGELRYPGLEGKPHGLVVAIQYVSNERLDYAFLRTKIAAVLKRLQDEVR